MNGKVVDLGQNQIVTIELCKTTTQFNIKLIKASRRAR